MNLPATHQRIFDILKGFDDGKSMDEIQTELYPDNNDPLSKPEQRKFIEEVFENRAWYEDRLLDCFPGIRRWLYAEDFIMKISEFS